MRYVVLLPQTRYGFVVAVAAVGSIAGLGMLVLNVALTSAEARSSFAWLAVVVVALAFGVGTRIASALEQQRMASLMERDIETFRASLSATPSGVRENAERTAVEIAQLTSDGGEALLKRHEVSGFTGATAARVLANAAARTGRTQAVEAAIALGTRMASKHRWAVQRAAAYQLAAATVYEGMDDVLCRALGLAVLQGQTVSTTASSLATTQLAATPVPTTSTKRCRDCAETVLADARICRYCRFEFTPPDA